MNKNPRTTSCKSWVGKVTSEISILMNDHFWMRLAGFSTNLLLLWYLHGKLGEYIQLKSFTLRESLAQKLPLFISGRVQSGLEMSNEVGSSHMLLHDESRCRAFQPLCWLDSWNLSNEHDLSWLQVAVFEIFWTVCFSTGTSYHSRRKDSRGTSTIEYAIWKVDIM